MKRLSIRMRMTLWFTMAMIVVILITYASFTLIASQILQKTIKDDLVETVENNVDEVEFYDTFSTDDTDVYVAYGEGYLEVDDDFLDIVNEVYTALYSEDARLVYGENPITKATSSLAFVDGEIQIVEVDGTTWYVFDRQLDIEGLSESLWMRGVVSETQGDTQILSILRIAMLILPLLIVFVAIGGYFMAYKMLKPIQKISDTADEIAKEGDLKRRIEIGEGDDELHHLADSFNRMFDQLEKNFENEKQFTSDASHELRTPLAVILSQCELSLEGAQTCQQYIQALEVIQRQGKKMNTLVNSLLDYTRLTLQSERYPDESLDFSSLMISLCEDMAFIHENGITLHYQIDSDITFWGNRTLLNRMATNIISNAYRYGRPNGHILVKLYELDAIYLVVEDDGKGIDAKDLNKIFNRFYQTDASRSNEGLGMGLAMVESIVKRYKGKIEVESEVGQGSIFTIILPNQ